MTRLRDASLFVAVVAGNYAVLMLIDGQLIDFGITAAICAGSSVAAGLIAYASSRRRKAVARGRAAVWERRDHLLAAAYQQCPLCRDARQKPSNSARFVDRQGACPSAAMCAGRQSRVGTMNPRPVSVPVLMTGQPDWVRRPTTSPYICDATE